MEKIIIRTHETPAGLLLLGSYCDKLCLCDWKYRKMREPIDRRMQSCLKAEYNKGNSPVLDKAVCQLDLYFKGHLKSFQLPLFPVGTEFQRAVWMELMKIPYGKTTTYGKLSESLGNGRAIRAVASANGANALSIIIPCHRVIGVKGELVGYAGGLDAKRKLLSLESSILLQPELF